MSSGAALDSILRRECSHIGKSFEHSGASRFIARPSGRSLFAKLDDHVEQTLGEAHSLIAMHKAQSGSSGEPAATLSPQVHAFGKTQDGNRAYLVTDYLDLKPSLGRDAQKALGRRLAEMHKHGSEDGRFGFHAATYCGVTVGIDTVMQDRIRSYRHADSPDPWDTIAAPGQHLGSLLAQILGRTSYRRPRQPDPCVTPGSTAQEAGRADAGQVSEGQTGTVRAALLSLGLPRYTESILCCSRHSRERSSLVYCTEIFGAYCEMAPSHTTPPERRRRMLICLLDLPPGLETQEPSFLPASRPCLSE